MLKPALFFPFLFVAQLVIGQYQFLFPMVQNNKIGYINSKGSTVIPAIYHIAFDFAEGLAAVREHGLYGFIDSSGQYVLAAEFDYATYFERGITLVHKKGHPYFIDKTGKPVFPAVYRSLEFINDRKGIITTISQKMGIIDIQTGQLLLDTAYLYIRPFTHSVTMVRRYKNADMIAREEEEALIDTAGKFIIPFGRFNIIAPFYDGYASVLVDRDNNTYGTIDITGRLLTKKAADRTFNITGEFHEGRSKFSKQTADKQYEGFIDLNGDTILNDPAYESVFDFSCGRAFAKHFNGEYHLLDRNGKRIGPQTFTYPYDEKFNKDYAVVQTSSGWGIIDTNANFIVAPQYEFLYFPDNTTDYFFFGGKGNTQKLTGVASLKNQVIIPTQLEAVAHAGFVNGLMRTMVNKKLTYYNLQGRMVWQEKPIVQQKPKPLNIDHMIICDYIAYDYGKGTKAKKTTDHRQFSQNAFALKINTTPVDTFNSYTTGYKLFVSNTTKDTIKFNGYTGRLFMKLQALDTDGQWKGIESTPNSWCSVSAHSIELLPGTFLSYTIPQFEGSMPTKIRAVLYYVDKNDPENELMLYSNAINATINPGQLWRPEGEYSKGVRSPGIYFE